MEQILKLHFDTFLENLHEISFYRVKIEKFMFSGLKILKIQFEMLSEQSGHFGHPVHVLKANLKKIGF